MTPSASNPDDDREAWDRLFQGRTERRLAPPYKLGVRLDPEFGNLISVTISQMPDETTRKLWFETELCPICGGSTAGAARIAASLTLRFDSGMEYGQCVWAHPACFESCPDTGVEARIPW
jgi:hypothetical protein